MWALDFYIDTILDTKIVDKLIQKYQNIFIKGRKK